MIRADLIKEKIVTIEQLKPKIAQWRGKGKTVAFTNGVFDVLHAGHIASLSQAAAAACYLVVALNTDASVKRLKGESRPINSEGDRALIMAALVMVDAVVLFDEDTPLTLIQSILPDVLVKGGDYTIDQIVGAKDVISNGGRVVINKILEGFSSTNIIAKMGL
jgi:D-beta-D-heptose 7-phosphate kinase/D-beta-D-heptose 1-phosphate adenosyltransferase